MKQMDEIHKAINLFDEISQDNEVLQKFKYHSIRVGYLSSILGNKLGCYDNDLRIAGLLHDLGKIGISKDILFKEGQLTNMEYMIIQSHSHIGNNIVRKLLGLPRVAEFIRDHHERWDGQGYPRGLEGEEITLQGRIICICDAFDTMTIDRRNYNKDTLSYEEAYQELERCAWSHFDGDIVTEFIQTFREINLPNPRLWSESTEEIVRIFQPLLPY